MPKIKKSLISHGGLVFVEHLVVLGHGHAKDDGRHIFKAMDPLLPLRSLASNIEKPETQKDKKLKPFIFYIYILS